MKKIILFVVALLTVSFASLDVTSFENGSQNQSIPNIRLKNNGGNISGFKIYYYFSAADTKDILIDSYYLAGGSAAIEKITENQYRAVLDFSGNALGAGNSFPNSGYLQFGLHYYDWSKWNEKDDFSYLGNQINSLNDRIVVTSLSGDVLAGVFPNGTDLRVVISIADHDGRIVARLVRANAPAGYNSLNWNSENVPSDRYTVTIEHNGSISGNNVLLK